MKKIILIALSLLFYCSIFAQKSSVLPIVQQSSEYINLIEGKYKQQVVHLEYDIIKESKEIYRQMFADVQYGFILFGDEKFNNFSLKVSVIENDDWKVIIDEVGSDGIVTIFRKLPQIGTYKFEINADLKQGKDYGYYNLIVFR